MNEIKVLDHGFVRLVEAWGHGDAGHCQGEKVIGDDMECGIIEAARQSTQASFRGWDADQKLLTYLFNHKPQHIVPFEFAGMTIEVQAPIFVFREWRTHRTAPQIDEDYFAGDEAYNEMSARYAPLPAQNYVPTVERLLRTSKTNKQAATIKGAAELTEEQAEWFRRNIEYRYTADEHLYQQALQTGVPKELARIILPVGRYSRMRVTSFLRNWFGFITLRSHPDAQEEIREYSRAVETILKETFPRTYALFVTVREGK